MNSITLKSIFVALLLLCINGCSTTPTHLIVSPEITLSPSNQLTGRETQLSVIDMRTSPHIIQILEANEPAVIFSAQKRLEDTIKETLIKEWQNQALTFSDTAKNKMTVAIEKAIISIDQESVSYSAQSEIIIKVTVDNSEQTLTSSFKKRAFSEGALSADIKAIETEFNQHLSSLLTQVLVSKDIKTFL